eukprot:SAG22_NODE_428_length_10591_cov_8.858178_1_plen_346_part_10
MFPHKTAPYGTVHLGTKFSTGVTDHGWLSDPLMFQDPFVVHRLTKLCTLCTYLLEHGRACPSRGPQRPQLGGRTQPGHMRSSPERLGVRWTILGPRPRHSGEAILAGPEIWQSIGVNILLNIHAVTPIITGLPRCTAALEPRASSRGHPWPPPTAASSSPAPRAADLNGRAGGRPVRRSPPRPPPALSPSTDGQRGTRGRRAGGRGQQRLAVERRPWAGRRGGPGEGSSAGHAGPYCHPASCSALESAAISCKSGRHRHPVGPRLASIRPPPAAAAPPRAGPGTTEQEAGAAEGQRARAPAVAAASCRSRRAAGAAEIAAQIGRRRPAAPHRHVLPWRPTTPPHRR